MMRLRISPFALLIALFVGAAAEAGPRSTWRKYVAAVAKKDDLEILACYASPFRQHVSSRESRLQVHLEEIYGLISRDYAIKIGRSRKAGTRTLLKVRFDHQTNADASFETEVPFINEGREWLIEKPPEPVIKPSYWQRRLKSLTDMGLPLYLGIAAGGLLLLALVRKLLDVEN